MYTASKQIMVTTYVHYFQTNYKTMAQGAKKDNRASIHQDEH